MSRTRNGRLPLDVLTRRAIPSHWQTGRFAGPISPWPSPAGPVLCIEPGHRDQYQDDRKNAGAFIHIPVRLHVNETCFTDDNIRISTLHSLTDSGCPCEAVTNKLPDKLQHVMLVDEPEFDEESAWAFVQKHH